MWLGVTMAIALLPYVVLIPEVVQFYPDVVHDDAVNFVVWLRRTLDPGLFPNDPIARDMAAVTPWFYAALFRPFAAMGIDPVLTHIAVVMPLSGLLLAFSAFVAINRFWQFPPGACVATLILVWLVGTPQGLPRDFGYAIVLLAVVGFESRRAALTGLGLFLAAGLLPAAALVSGVAMSLLMLAPRPRYVTRERLAWRTLLAAGGGAVAGGLVAIARKAGSGAAISLAEARTIPFFASYGRRPFFGETFASTYGCNERAGLLPLCEGGPDAWIITWGLLVAGLLVGAIWFVSSGAAGRWFRAVGQPMLDRRIATIWVTLLATGCLLFILAHRVAFSLHMPERYSRYSITLAFALATAITATSLASVGVAWTTKRGYWRQFRWPLAAAASILVAFAAVREGRRIHLVLGDAPAIFDFLRRTPKETVVGGVLFETDYVPAFSSRAVLVSMELLTPYHMSFYNEMSKRAIDIGASLYQQTPRALVELRKQYRVDYVLVERDPAYVMPLLQMWARNFPSVSSAVGFLNEGGEPFFRRRLPACEVAGNYRVALADAACLAADAPR